MIKKIKKFFIKSYFDKSLPFDYRLYMVFFFITLIISTISATTNTLLGAGLFGVIIQHIYNICCVVILFISRENRMRIYKPHLIFTTHVYLPFMFFQTAGYQGTSLLFVPLGLFLLCIVFSKKLRKFLIITCSMIFATCSLLEYHFPKLVVPFQGPQAQIIDLMVAMLITFSGMAVLAVYVSKSYRGETDRIEQLLQELEFKNFELEETSIRDALTGVYNRLFLSEFLEQEMQSCRNSNGHIFVFLADIDYFKKVNDQFGHSTGDEVLKTFAQTIQSSLWSSDVVARYGGEEFVGVLQSEDRDAAYAVVERVRLTVQALEFNHNLKITASFGLTMSRPEDTVASILERADTYMYQAKQTGRNKVVCNGDFIYGKEFDRVRKNH